MKRKWIEAGIGAVLLAAGLLCPLTWLRIVLFLGSYAVVGWRVLWKAVRNLCRGQILDENFLMCVASVGALCLQEWAEGAMVMLLYRVGENFEDMAVAKSRRSITDLMDICPETAVVLREGKPVTVDPAEVAVGEILTVAAGEKIPLDGVILQGASELNTAALTGESMPVSVQAGDEVQSGCVNGSGVLQVRVEKPYAESTAARILELVENSSSRKSVSENFISRFAAWYTPVVVGLAVLLAIVPPLVLPGATFSDWVYRALNFLVVSCPCALVISVPLSFFSGIGSASRRGILIKGSNYLEALSKCGTAAFDKTGTMTEGKFAVSGVFPAEDGREEELLYYAASVEQHSHHPIAVCISHALAREKGQATEIREIAGYGVEAVVDGHRIQVGNRRLLEEAGVSVPNLPERAGSCVYVTKDSSFLGCVQVSDCLKSDAARTILALRKRDVHTVLLTGDRRRNAEETAAALGIDTVYAELLPEGKVKQMETLLREKKSGRTVVYTGDGMNDAPVLALADVGVAMGGLGSDAAIEAADVVIMNDAPSKLVDAMEIAKKTMRIVKENIVFALGVKAIVLITSTLGYSGLWLSIFADVGVSILAILNALRAMRAPRTSR